MKLDLERRPHMTRFSNAARTFGALWIGLVLSSSAFGSETYPEEVQPTAETLDITNPGSDLAPGIYRVGIQRAGKTPVWVRWVVGP